MIPVRNGWFATRKRQSKGRKRVNKGKVPERTAIDWANEIKIEMQQEGESTGLSVLMVDEWTVR